MGRRASTDKSKLTEAGYIIRRRQWGEGRAAYVLDRGMVDGRRVREQFTTLEAARAAARRASIDRERLGVAAKGLTEAARQDAAKALAMLLGTGATLEDAAALYLRMNAPPAGGITFGRLAADFLDWMKTTRQKLGARTTGGYRPETLAGAGKALRRVARDFADTPAAAITAPDLRAWLDAQGVGAVTWGGLARYVSMAYTWATGEGRPLAGGANPAYRLKPPPKAATLPTIYDPAEVERIMHHIEGKRPDLAGAFAVLFFAGLRPEELRRIDPEAVDFEAGEIHVPAEASKTSTPRLVTLQANLRSWLELYPLPSRGLSAAALTRFRAELCRGLAVTWSQDIPRHCFATYHCALFGMDRTAEELGHTSTAMLHKHYKGLARNRRAAAARFFAIQPKAAADKAPQEAAAGAWRVVEAGA